MSSIRRALLIYTDPYYLVKQIYPYGLDLLATRLRQEGIDTRIEYAFLPGTQALTNLSLIFAEFRPDLVGLGIRNLDTCMACEDYGDLTGDGYRSFFFLPQVREVADAVRKLGPEVPLVCGGGGFTIEPQGILDYLDIDYGIVGEGEDALAAFAQYWPDRSRLQDIPGIIMRTADGFKKMPRKTFAFPNLEPAQRDAGFHHAFASASLPVRVKRGCNQTCIFCVEPIIEGSRFVYRDPVEVIGELQKFAALEQVNKVFFVDTEFNIPDLTYATQLLDYLLAAGLNSRYRFVSQFLPRPFTDAFARLLAKAGMSVIMTVTSFADTVLSASGTSYRQSDIVNAIELCARHDIDLTIDLIFGLPGETWE
ncbi:MAG: cobalamin B12-binding domain-containing protein, partial [Desulfofustis sp.]|nr:cobalamin B12-binding domain-containing protein [Desulfofustis sp.]